MPRSNRTPEGITSARPDSTARSMAPGWIAITALITLPAFALAQPAATPVLPNGGFEQADDDGFPTGWRPYNWGPEDSAGQNARSVDVARSGVASLRAESRDGAARPGAYTRLRLEPGRYALRFFARTEQGHTALVRAYLGDRYSPPYVVSDEWTEIVYRHSLPKQRVAAEINVQNFGGEPCVVWLDDLQLRTLPEATAQVVTDTRPVGDQPRLLYFSGNLNHIRDTAQQWVKRGFSGFFFSYIMHDWRTNVWEQDGQPDTAGRDDQLSLEAQKALREAGQAGLTDNALKVAFYSELPDPFSDEAYTTLRENFRQGARFAREAGFRMIAIDTEYVAKQYNYSWQGYGYDRYTRAELAAKLRERWREVGRVMASAYPQVEFGVLPEGMLYYGPLWIEVFAGLLEGVEAGRSEGDVHLFCEGTYSLRDPEQIREHAQAVRATTEARLNGQAKESWQKRGQIALGAWPLGYYRAVRDERGEFLGWSGKKDKFGDRIVGSYADKSERYSLEEFRTQLAAIRTFSDRYCWIYGHGSSWWQITPDQADRYARKAHRFGRENYLLPTVSNIQEYYDATATRDLVQLARE